MDNVNILIVEDEQRLADILKKQLVTAGFNVDIAYDGYIGKQFAQKNKYDIIILDINLPLINGYDLLSEGGKKKRKMRSKSKSGTSYKTKSKSNKSKSKKSKSKKD